MIRVPLLSSAITLFTMGLVASTALAEDIQIVNETKEEIAVSITPEDTSSSIVKTIPAKESSVLMINYDDLKEHEYFNIKKSGGDFAGLSRCGHLNVKKQYKITFKKEAMGLICTAEEIS